MASISIKVNGLAGTQKMLSNLKIETPKSIAKSLNQIATKVKDEEKEEMKRVFDRPTPWALGAITTEKATTEKLQSKTDIRDAAKASYLLPQIEGGHRKYKHYEQVLKGLGLLPSGWYAVPGPSIVLDNYGNMASGDIKKILNTLRGTTKAGQRRSGSLWVVQKQTGKVRPGIYDVSNYSGFGGKIDCLFIYVTNVSYNKLFKFYDYGEDVFNKNWKGIVNSDMTEMLRKEV